MALLDDTAPVAPLENLFNAISTQTTADIAAGLKTAGQSVATLAARNALFPAPVQGDRVYRTDLGHEEAYYGLYNVTTNPGGRTVAGWAEVGARDSVRSDATNSTIFPRTQIGFGKITGDGTAQISETVTFPAAFGAVPAIIVNYIGYRAAGAFNIALLSISPTSLVPAGQSPSATGFTAALENPTAGALIAGNDYYYSWIAIGAA